MNAEHIAFSYLTCLTNAGHAFTITHSRMSYATANGTRGTNKIAVSVAYTTENVLGCRSLSVRSGPAVRNTRFPPHSNPQSAAPSRGLSTTLFVVSFMFCKFLFWSCSVYGLKPVPRRGFPSFRIRHHPAWRLRTVRTILQWVHKTPRHFHSPSSLPFRVRNARLNLTMKASAISPWTNPTNSTGCTKKHHM